MEGKMNLQDTFLNEARKENVPVSTSQQFRNFRTETAYDLIGCIDNNPFFMSCFFVCRNGLVT